jgi:hypothetical protein
MSPFKFLNIWADREEFMDIVRVVWQNQISGNPMYCFTTKLRLLKIALRTLHRHHISHISYRVAEAKTQRNLAQMTPDKSLALEVLIAIERNHARLYNQLCKDEEAIYKQWSRIQWLQLGDKTPSFSIDPLGSGLVRCAMKVDLRKAFNTISWDFIMKGLQAINILERMVGWIQTCISSAYFSISLNGELQGFFQSSRGLR